MSGGLGATLRSVAPAMAVSTALGYVLFVGVGRLLGPADFALFAAFWGLLFAVGGMTAPLEQETARLVASGVDPGHPRLVQTGLTVGSVLGVGVLLVFPVTVGRVLDGSWPLALVVVLAALGFAVQSVVRGIRLGAASRSYAALVVSEPAVRLLVLGGLLLLVAPSVGVAAAAVAAGSFAWLLFLRPSVARSPGGTVEPSPPGQALRQLGLLTVAAGCTAGVVTGFPAVAAVFAPAGSAEELGSVVAALTVTRLPLLVFGPVQAVLVPVLVRRRSAGDHGAAGRLVAQVVLWAAAASVLLAAVALAVGPSVVELVYGSEFRVARLPLAVLTLGAGLVVVQLLLTAAVLASGRHGWVLGSWGSCLAVVVAVLAVGPGTLTASVATAVTAGPVVGVAVAVRGLAVPRVASGAGSDGSGRESAG